MKERKVKWVSNPYKEIPKKVRDSADIKPGDGLIGLAGDDGVIYLVKGRATESTLQHERFHLIYNHPKKERDPRAWVLHEMQANVYAYKNTGQPKHLLARLRAIFNDICFNVYDVDERKALILIHSALSRTKAPDAWMSDFIKLKEEVGDIGR
jgi:bifunctional DNA-binding transcriptional regulator/antitoxin component of YhaV-PrlF toxin-antitoxin module